jgi:epoxyqueuosine reductase
MRYIADRSEAYEHPRHVLDGVRTILMLAMGYRTLQPRAPAQGQGRVSRYAWGIDYHDVIRARLRRLVALHRRLLPGAPVRGVVDTAPLLEREFAELAGLGWIAKNTLVLNRQWGSWLFLAALLSGAELDCDEPHEGEHCGSCRACVDACPTGALVEPYRLDARRCISYLTIELRGPIPDDKRRAAGEWLFGCDICQDVCPWNRRVPESAEERFRPRERMNPVDLAPLFELDEQEFRERFRRTPLWRSKRRGLLRNAAVVLGNRGDAAALPALFHGLEDSEALVRGACAWALGRYDCPAAREVLTRRLALETDPSVRSEIEAALRDSGET